MTSVSEAAAELNSADKICLLLFHVSTSNVWLFNGIGLGHGFLRQFIALFFLSKKERLWTTSTTRHLA